jgi:hypothetical protein
VYKFLISYTGGNTKGIGNLNSAYEKADIVVLVLINEEEREMLRKVGLSPDSKAVKFSLCDM